MKVFNKNVNKKELVDSLKKSIKMNSNALDYVENCINKCQDLLNYNENDLIAKNDLENLQYIKFTLNYLEKQYNESLRGLAK